MSNLMKCADRAARTVCKHCGKGGVNRETYDQLYWGHDLDGMPNKWCDRCQVKRHFVLLNSDGTPHDCRQDVPAPVKVPEPWQHAPVPSPAEPVNVPNETQASQPGQDKSAAVAALIEALSPKVDAAEVKRMLDAEMGGYKSLLLDQVQAKINEITAPVTVKVQTERETRTIPGLTHKSVPVVLTVLNSGEHCLMVGPAGTGKSTIAEQCAQALELGYYSVSLSPQTPASALLGYMQAAGQYVRSLYREAFEHGGVFHFDEFDNAHPSVLAVINASLANGQMAFPDRMVKRHPDFRVCASANTYGRGPDRQYVGRQALDAATLDRFTIVTVEYDKALENALCLATGASETVVREVNSYIWALRANAERHKMTLIFSPRASVGMCRLINAGLPVSEAIESRARRGASDQDWSKVSSGVSLPRL